MSGNKKYYVKMDRFGNYVRVVVWDTNFCYDSGTKASTDAFKKEDVKADAIMTGLASGVTEPTSGEPAATFCNSTKAVDQ